MRRISSPIALLLLFVLPLQMGCMTTKVSQLDRPQKYPSTLKEGQKVRVHYVDKNIKPLEGIVKKATMEAVVVTHQLPGDKIRRDTEISYKQMHEIEIMKKKLNVGKTILVTGGAIGLGSVALLVWLLLTFETAGW